MVVANRDRYERAPRYFCIGEPSDIESIEERADVAELLPATALRIKL
jgi:hypothetical protein